MNIPSSLSRLTFKALLKDKAKFQHMIKTSKHNLPRMRAQSEFKMTSLSDDESSILPFIPLILRGNSFYWPPRALDALKALSRGPGSSLVDSGETLFDFIVDIRHELGLQHEPWKQSVGEGYALFFDDLIPRVDSRKWFVEIVPSLANLMLRFPVILENHYKENSTDDRVCEGNSSGGKDSGEGNEGSRVDTSLRILHPQRPGIVLLSQELVASLLACALFCLFPKAKRQKNELPVINFDGLFAGIARAGENQENKIKCIVHYFERICNGMPSGVVSFERKVLPFKDNSFPIIYPNASFWSESKIPLCPFKAMETGTIEDHEEEALEVDFANEYLGGGALSKGCVQEEIRFMINPELIAGMLFLPAMQENEAIEIVGAERFSKYEGYASGFRFAGDYVDTRCRDFIGRRETKIAAIDALCYSGEGQFKEQKLTREANKAFCGFLDHAEIHSYFKFIKKVGIDTEQHGCRGNYYRARCKNGIAGTSAMQLNFRGNNLGTEEDEECSGSEKNAFSNRFSQQLEIAEPSVLRDEPSNEIAQTSLGRENDGAQDLCLHPSPNNIGIATGNWGCGAFGGDVELKSMLQWLAASQASRPFVLYFTFGHTFSKRLIVLTEWIRCHSWTVGELWGMLIEYSSQRLQGNMYCSFFEWVLPRINEVDKQAL